MSEPCNRRDFLRTTVAAGMGLGVGTAALSGRQSAATAQYVEFAAPPIDLVRVGFVGIGDQGYRHLRNLVRIEGVELKALCDIMPERVERGSQLVEAAGQRPPAAYARGETDFVRMCEEEDLDLVFNATPWDLHVPICLAAMENGKHAATEIPAATSLQDCWKLVETAEKTRRHCVMMENCCYDRTELMILNMVRADLFGELLHAECGYLHDLREYKLSDFYQGRWRIDHSIKRNADLYPTHGLGPVAQWLDINRGNQFDYLVSMATKSLGLNLYAAQKYGPESSEATQRYALGDIVNTLIRTRRGETILITHDTNLPRPYSRKILLQGTKGLVRKYPEQKIHIEGRSKSHTWEELKGLMEEFEHPLWRTLADKARGAGHGGMDYIEDFRLIQCLREGKPMDMDVYDAAAWSSIIELSERSISNRGRPVEIPDFTHGAWKNREPLCIVGAPAG
jgi:hypothetical protein